MGRSFHVQTFRDELRELRRQLYSVTVSEQSLRQSRENKILYWFAKFSYFNAHFRFYSPIYQGNIHKCFDTIWRVHYGFDANETQPPSTGLSHTGLKFLQLQSQEYFIAGLIWVGGWISWSSGQSEKNYRRLPIVFQQHFGKKVVAIIDCFEVFSERPSRLIARAMTWSNYKHHNTVKT